MWPGWPYDDERQTEAAFNSLRRELEEAKSKRENAILAAAEANDREQRLREALETICEIGETRDVQVARAALAPDTEPPSVSGEGVTVKAIVERLDALAPDDSESDE